jgi:predicted tellurium resistance membrane protein TerC
MAPARCSRYTSQVESLANPDVWIALVTLSAMEIVLGIDNIVFISILVGRVAPERRNATRKIGIAAALITRLGLLFTLSWIMRLTEPLFAVLGHSFSGKDLIMVGGGLFLLFKATLEIHNKLEGGGEEVPGAAKVAAGVGMVIFQIMLVDIVFSLDSVITAVGMARQLWVMVVAMVLAVAVMLAASGFIADFVERHPSVKMLALSFLILIGVMLMAEGFGQHVDKGYIYFAMGFSLFVELLNIRRSRKKGYAPVHLHGPQAEPS